MVVFIQSRVDRQLLSIVWILWDDYFGSGPNLLKKPLFLLCSHQLPFTARSKVTMSSKSKYRDSIKIQNCFLFKLYCTNKGKFTNLCSLIRRTISRVSGKNGRSFFWNNKTCYLRMDCLMNSNNICFEKKNKTTRVKP